MQLLSDINNKLNVLIGLFYNISNYLTNEKPTEGKKIKDLVDYGLSYSNIAKLTNKTNQQIADQVYNMTKRKEKKVKNE